MEISGRLFKKCPAETGEGKNGPWKKQTFVIETVETYPKQIAFNFFNDRIMLDSFNEGDMVKVSFDLESREYQGKWYNDIRSWKMETDSGIINSAPSQTQLPPLTENDIPAVESSADDDLPF